MKFIKNLLIVILTLVISYLVSPWAGNVYQYVSNDPGTWVDLRGVFGLPLAYIFFLTLLFTAFGDTKKYWWIGTLLIPALWFEIYFDLSHIYFPIALGLVGWLIGFGISKLLAHKYFTSTLVSKKR